MISSLKDVTVFVDGKPITGFADAPACEPPGIIEFTLHATAETSHGLHGWLRKVVSLRRRAQARRARLLALFRQRSLS